MSISLTIVIPNRNRDLNTVKRSLASIVPQLNDVTQLVIVDYGSEISYQVALEKLIASFDKIELILCPTQGQLWNKSRCINIVLQSCTTSHFMVSDMDMIWHPDFIKNQLQSLSQSFSVYFTVGMMTQEESILDKAFKDYAIKFQTNEEATGISIFPTLHLKSINGFDEFYHGWGSEDTDVHVRLQHAGYEVRFRESEIFFKHQWHEKVYRSKQSTSPFHPYLERVNQSYLSHTQELKKVKANCNHSWGKLCDAQDYQELSSPSILLKKYAVEQDILAIIFSLKTMGSNNVIEIQIANHPESKSIKNSVKKGLGKKTPRFMPLEKANVMLLQAIVMNHHSCAYTYSYNKQNEIIKFVINLKSMLSK